jgi:mono/diheme cytochrome c family protein
MNKRLLTLFGMVLLVLAGCDSHAPGTGRSIASLTGPALQRDHDPQQVALGESLYRQHCVECHGQGAEGSPDWRHRDTEGMFPPPPLNGTGHAWHHSTSWLKQMILDGSPAGQGKMPAWRGRLSEPEVEALITWFQSLWPDEVYVAWHEMQQNNK